MPSFGFRRIRQAAHGGQLVHTEGGNAFLSNDEKREYLLCAECEQRIGVWENAVSKIVKQRSGAFPALDTAEATRLMNGEPVRRITAIDRDVLVKFVLSVYWRASISVGHEFALGPRDEEDVRLYLLDQAPFPERMRLVVELLDPPKDKPIDWVMTPPDTARLDGLHRGCVFLFLGLSFMLLVGDVPPSANLFSFERSGLALVSDGEAQFSRIRREFAECMQAGRVKGKLAQLNWIGLDGKVGPPPSERV
ncbi:MAG: hypothetical protein HOW73_39100 [Polyangiaceae bacterium]|nr:hypothetical protein [Polyangiaceae bacterium]